MTLENGKYYTGLRRYLIQQTIMIGATVNRLALGISLDIRKVEEGQVDYSYYLGKDYKAKYRPPPKGGRIPTIISPHVSANDIPLLQKAFDGDMSFVAGEFMLSIPLYGAMCKALGCVFVPRAGSKDQLDKTLAKVLERQELVEEKGELPPLLIFPEGTCSNTGATTTLFTNARFYSQKPDYAKEALDSSTGGHKRKSITGFSTVNGIANQHKIRK